MAHVQGLGDSRASAASWRACHCGQRAAPRGAPLCVRREGQIQPPGTLDSLWFYDVLYGPLKFLNPKHLKIIQQ